MAKLRPARRQAAPRPAEVRTLLEVLTDGIQVFDAQGVMVSRNPAAARLYEIDESEPTVTAILEKWELIREDGSILAREDGPLADAMRTGAASEGAMVGMRSRADGRVRWLSVSAVPIREVDGEISGYVSCARDLTERMETIRGLRVLTAAAYRLGSSLVPEEVIQALTDASSELCSSPGERPRRAVVMIVDGDTLIMSGLTDPSHSATYDGNRVALADQPYARRVLSTGETLVTGFSPDDFGPSQSEVVRKAGVRNAAMIPMRRGATIFAILAVSGRQEAMISGDILERLHTLAAMGARAFANAEAHQRASLASRTDPLTGLGNRRALDERFAQLPRGPFSLVAIDVDHLKAVNDAHGHQAGDRLLTAVATAMAQQMRPSDALLRIGGDEFVALLAACGPAGATAAVTRLRAAVADVALPWGRASVSVGCAAANPGESLPVVLARADAALYQAKAARPGTWPGDRDEA